MTNDYTQVRRELVIVDTTTPNYEQLVRDATRNTDGARQIEVSLIEPDANGVQAIGELLSGTRELDAIHLVSHGGPGLLQLGNVTLNAENLNQYADQIRSWEAALVDGADLLLYGCDVAANEAGREFVSSLQDLTGADVAASVDPTGAVSRGGDWDLEYALGPIETQLAFSADVQSHWDDTLAPYDLETFPAGSYVIDMGQPQTVANALKPYGLVYDLTMNQKAPVNWVINPSKDYPFNGAGTGQPADPVGSAVDFTATTIPAPWTGAAPARATLAGPSSWTPVWSRRRSRPC